MANEISKIAEVRNLRSFAASLRGAVQRWHEKYADKKHYDKQGFRFVHFNDRGVNAFSANVSFEAYVGVYGSSSVSNAWRLESGMASRYFIRALNCHQQLIFDTMAQLAEQDAAAGVAAAEAELAKMQEMLNEARAAPVSDVAA